MIPNNKQVKEMTVYFREGNEHQSRTFYLTSFEEAIADLLHENKERWGFIKEVKKY